MRSNIELMSRRGTPSVPNGFQPSVCLLHGVVSVAGGLGFGLGTLLVGGALSFGFNRTMVQIHRGQQPALETYLTDSNAFCLLVAYLILGVATMIGFVF